MNELEFIFALIALKLNPYACNFARRSLWERQSDALERSLKILQNDFPLSSADFQFSNIDKRQY